MRYTHLFFDLDGTLIDSSPGITHSVQYAMEQLGRTAPPAEELLCFIGPPLLDAFAGFFGLSREDAARAVSYYRECYRAGAMLECSVYDGITELLDRANAAGIPCVLATCKPTCFAKQILEHFDLCRRFAFLSGPELDGTRGEKHEVIAYAMEQLGIENPASVLMIGDRDNDVLGAARHGMDCIGALWGFGSPEELTRSGACATLQSPSALSKMLFGD